MFSSTVIAKLYKEHNNNYDKSWEKKTHDKREACKLCFEHWVASLGKWIDNKI